MTESQRTAFTQKIMGAVDEWGLSAAQILNVLDFPEGVRSRALQKYRAETPFPDEDRINNRMQRLLGIIDALRTTYPRNLAMGAHWMKMPHRRFQNRSPLHTMLEDGEGGVIAVLSELDCAYAWELSGSQRN